MFDLEASVASTEKDTARFLVRLDVGVLHPQLPQGLTDDGLDLAAELLHDIAGQIQGDAAAQRENEQWGET